jgi:type IV secretory pathway TraG/TraD family ATPase VirD4
VTQGKNELPEFHPQTVIRDWGNGQAFRLADAQTGVCVFGATGSGKTSGPAKHLAYGYLAAGFGGLVLCAKKDECRQWQEWAAETGREDDLVIIDASGGSRFNFMTWEASRPEAGGGLGINIVNLLDEIATAISGNTEGGGNSKFWEDALHHLNTNLVDLALLAKRKVTLPELRSILTTAAIQPEQVIDEVWQEKSECAKAIDEADRKTTNADPNERASFEQCRDYWLLEYPNLNEKTRSIITLTFSMLVRPLITPPLRQIFSTDTNIKPEDTFDGKIIIVDLPVQEYRLVGRIASLAWKYCFQIAVLRRVQPANRESFLRPVFLWADEAQNFVSKFDSEYQAVARSAAGCTVYLTQNRESFRRVLKNNDAVDSLLGNLQAKFFCQNSGETNEWASKLLGERWLHINSTNVGQSLNDTMQQQEQNAGKHSSGVTRSAQRRFFVEPARFTTLKRGGALNNFQVEAIVYNGGNLFHDGRESLPYKFITFNQK